ncbi:bis(5'-nucleosyl)-tetraphosphatase (symmetrical) YqeK [Furfurilactobacillus entadae]|uniref:bis(5'-nucleosyl)-tetraphosphatase (symmetrical) YqeK n=1 Tax=Furfurilactobacillus entadae TaxID=2922307 RepID=UPI0035EB366D
MNENLHYQQHIYNGTRAELIEAVHAKLNESRFDHVMRVEQTALALAEVNGVDLEKASIAGLVHDYAKQRTDDAFVAMIKKHHMDPDLLNWGNAIWHGVVGAEFVRDELGIYDEEILNAVRQHTTGAVEMAPLAQVTYMADYLEPARHFDGVEEARQVTAKDLAAGVAYQTEHTLTYLIEKHAPIYPATIATYNYWVANKKMKYNY